VEALGAKIVGEPGTNGLRLDLHGLAVNVTKFIDGQSREQIYGIEHIAVDTDDLGNLYARLKAGGARILEEMQVSVGRRVCFFEGPDGVQLEIVEIVK
jgi:catechol 2,3-dioxygenase-like lactoylglutathione lyase family enzyme